MQRTTNLFVPRIWRPKLQSPRSRWEPGSCAERNIRGKGVLANYKAHIPKSLFIQSLLSQPYPDNKQRFTYAAHAGARPRYRSPRGLRSLLQGDHRALPTILRSAVMRALAHYTRALATIRPDGNVTRLSRGESDAGWTSSLLPLPRHRVSRRSRLDRRR